MRAHPLPALALALSSVLGLAACAVVAPDDPGDDTPGDDAPDPDGRDDGVLVVEPLLPDPPMSPHLALGVPADATPDDDLVIVHAEMALGYSRFLNAANWVSWRTRPEDFGDAERYPGDFYPDVALPAAWYHPEHADLYGSGFDRGHMLRSEERTRSDATNYATFVMTNVLAQRPDLNRGPWFDFEYYVQSKVESFSRPRDAYVLAGPVWSAACATHAARVAGDGCADLGRTSDPARRIAIPEATWKVVVFVDAGEPVLEATDPYVVAVMMPNQNGIMDTRWWEYRSTVAAIEAATGYDLPSLE